MDKKAVEIVDNLLVFIATVELFRTNQLQERHLDDVQRDLLKHEWVADAVKYLRGAVRSGKKVRLTMSNSTWIDLLNEREVTK